MKWIDLQGQTFGLWSVLGSGPKHGNRTTWVCRCACGTERTVQSGNLRSGASASCGCFPPRTERAKTHGLRALPEYAIWKSMWARCTSPWNLRKRPKYADRMPSDEWRSFERFLSDMGRRPSDKHSIDRIDNDKPYSRDNCRWATWSEQNINKSDSRPLTIDGETLSVYEWARRFGVGKSVIYRRVKAGWDAERIKSTFANTGRIA